MGIVCVQVTCVEDVHIDGLSVYIVLPCAVTAEGIHFVARGNGSMVHAAWAPLQAHSPARHRLWSHTSAPVSSDALDINPSLKTRASEPSRLALGAGLLETSCKGCRSVILK